MHRVGQTYGVAKADGSAPDTVTSRRYYLADADFLVGLQGEEEQLRQLEQALSRPEWQVFLGRKAFVPGAPPWIPDGLKLGVDLESAVVEHPWPRPDLEVPVEKRRPAELRAVFDAALSPTGEVRLDQPIGAAFQHRQFAIRHVATRFLKLGKEVPIRRE